MRIELEQNEDGTWAGRNLETDLSITAETKDEVRDRLWKSRFPDITYHLDSPEAESTDDEHS